jgi:hypothetical protein
MLLKYRRINIYAIVDNNALRFYDSFIINNASNPVESKYCLFGGT